MEPGLESKLCDPSILALSHSDKPPPFKYHPSPASHPLTHTVACSLLSVSPMRYSVIASRMYYCFLDCITGL